MLVRTVSRVLPRHVPSLVPSLVLSALIGLSTGCKKEGGSAGGSASSGASGAKASAKSLKIGIVTDVGGRGDQSFNDSALRGVELWSAGKVYQGGSYGEATPQQLEESVGPDLASQDIHPLGITPVVLQSKAQEDYEPNLQLLVDQGVALAVGTGFMLENAVETTAKKNPDTKFLLIDSPIMDQQGKPYTLPNVRTVTFKEEQGSFLAGALAGLATKTGKVGFVGGMEIPLIKKFEVGFRAGVMTTNPKAAEAMLINYTGSFDNIGAGKQVAQDLLSKGADIVFHAAGSDGQGVIQAVKEAHDSAKDAGKPVWVIGVDSDQWHVAPNAVLTSMVKRVDLAVWRTVKDLTEGKFQAGDSAMGLAESGVGLAPIRVDLPNKDALMAKVNALRDQIIAGKIQVPATSAELTAFKGAP